VFNVSDDILHGVLSEDDGLVPQLVIVEISAAKLLYTSDPFTIVFYAIEPIFELSPALLFRQFRHCFRRCFRRFAHATPREEKFVPPSLAAFEERHTAIPSPPLVTLVARCWRQSQPARGRLHRPGRPPQWSDLAAR
jgi:hypothetical protein